MRSPLRATLSVLCALAATAATYAAEPEEMARELQLMSMGEMPPRHIPGAEFQVALLTYDDPHDTGLGDALAALVGRRVLLRSGVSSIGVIGYQGSYERTCGMPWSYFDKVEKLTEAQGASLAVWGMIQRFGDELVIDTYLQIPRHAREPYFTWRLRLPESMGGGDLVAHLRPDRIHVQRLRLPVTAGSVFVESAASITRLRTKPRPKARVTGEISQAKGYAITKRLGDWVYLQSHEGWAPLESNCEGRWCEDLLGAGGFAGGVLAHMAGPDSLPRARPGQTAEALAVEEQLRALEGLNAGRPQEIREQTMAIVEKWIGEDRLVGPDAERGIDRGYGLPPGGAAFANLYALGRIALALQEGFREQTEAAFDSVELDRDLVADIAFDLAEASLDDPRNTDVLHNLAVLFEYVGDSERADLARSLQEKYEASFDVAFDGPVPSGLSVEAEDVECLPIGDNGVAWGRVTNNVPDTSVRLYFRRMHDAVEDLYYVLMHPAGGGRYWGVFPKAEDRVLDRHDLIETREEAQEENRWAAWWREKDASDHRDPNDPQDQAELDDDLIRERASLGKKLPREWLAEMDDRTFQSWLEQLENEPAEYYVSVHAADGRQLARSKTKVTEVQESCRVELSEQERGVAENLTVGETAHWQRDEEVFHWLCPGIVTRIDPICVLRPDGICRKCLIAWGKKKQVLLGTAAIPVGTGVIIQKDPEPPVSPVAPVQ